MLMLAPDEYYTIESPCEGLYKEKGSRFLAFAYPVQTQDEIKEIVSQMQKKYHDARHCCYAWKLGMGEDNFRAVDDGEPSGTAGRPIYGQILSNSLTNILIVVIRYFGGIKLGTGGLIVAYKTASADAIQNGTVVVKQLEDTIDVLFAYDAMNDVMKAIKDPNITVLNQSFDLQCSCRIRLRHTLLDPIVAKLNNIKGVTLELL